MPASGEASVTSKESVRAPSSPVTVALEMTGVRVSSVNW
jgi:hypothetical protein